MNKTDRDRGIRALGHLDTIELIDILDMVAKELAKRPDAGKDILTYLNNLEASLPKNEA